MDEFLAIIFAMPTVPWTCLVIAALVYWMSVIAGALDMNVLGGGDADVGHGDVGGDVGDGDAGHGDQVGDADGDASQDPGGTQDASSGGVLTAVMNALKLRSVPVTISLSMLGLSGWLVSFLLTFNLSPLLPLPSVVTGLIVFLSSTVLATLATSIFIRPLAPLFRSRSAPRHTELIGKVVRITTGRVDGRFGEGHLQDGGAGLALQVRCADPDALSRNDEALILGWDTATESFEVEPMSRVDGRESKRK